MAIFRRLKDLVCLFFRSSLNMLLKKFGYEFTKIANEPYGIKWLNDIKDYVLLTTRI